MEDYIKDGFFKVMEIIDPKTIRVFPEWKFKGIKGDIVNINGYEIYETKMSIKQIEFRLENLLLNRYVELRKPFLSNPNHALTCRVFIETLDISRFLSKKY